MNTRLPFLRLSAVILFLGISAAAHADSETRARTERVGWARLKTTSPEWKRHSGSDEVLMRFLAAHTTLNIDPTWYEADVKDLDALCLYPLVFSQGIGMVEEARSRANLAEYLRRGGFLLIDSCINRNVTPDPDGFIVDQARVLAAALPGTTVRELPLDHEIYQCFFPIPGKGPPHTFHGAVYNPRWARHGLYGIEHEGRLVGIVSVSGLQCGWDRMVAPEGHDTACMRMLVNIYILAMTQSRQSGGYGAAGKTAR